MKILILDEEFPFPLNTGKRIRTFNLVTRLAQRHELRYLAYGQADSDGFRALADKNIQPVAVPPQVPAKQGPLFYLRLLANLFSQLPYIVSSHYSKPFAREFERCLSDEPPDLVLCEWSPYAVYLQSTSGIKLVIVAHNIEARIWKRYYETESSGLKRWYIGRQATKVERFEREAFKTVDGATGVSSDEAAAIKSFNPGLPVQVVENGVDLEYFKPDAAAPRDDHLVFTGAMDWRPNQDAVVYFVNRVFPLLRAEFPALQVTLVGREPPRHVLDLGRTDGVTVTGTVDDVRPYIAQAAVYIVPLRVGGGSRLKILEALAMKKAVVSTSVGAEGLELDGGRHLELADTTEQFAQTVSKLLRDPERRRQLGEDGRKLVEERYGWDAIAAKLESFLEEVVAGS